MANSAGGSHLEISARGLVLGVIFGVIYFGIAYGSREALAVVNNMTQQSSLGLTLSGDIFDFVNGPYYLVVIGALVVAKIAHRAVKSPLTVKGPLKMVLGAITGIFYYLIFAGGIVTLSVGIHSPAAGTFVLSITLLITLALLEASSGLKILQGAFEFMDGRKGDTGEPQPEAPPLMPAGPAA